MHAADMTRASTINGNDFERMLKAALINLQRHEAELNDMNVFPVSDGDTGTNMRLTLQNGIITASSSEHLGQYIAGVKSGMLLGARGNSGVILSQFFTGISDFLCQKPSAGVQDFFEAFVCAYKTAYSSVINPTEGTMLTVARLGAENIRSNLPSYTSVDALLADYINQMQDTLQKTPDMLPVLKDAGVLDSGGGGYIYIVQGMLTALTSSGQDFDIDFSAPQYKAKAPVSQLAQDADFNRKSSFNEGYCTEFILQRLEGSSYIQDFNFDSFKEELKTLGTSIVAFEDGDRVKVHIHTLKPHRVIEAAQRYGEFVTFKMDNMQIQKNAHDARVKKHKSIAVIAAVNGEGFRELYSSFNCDVIVDGGSTMNTSTQEFIDAFNSVEADSIIVLPNSKNIFLSAKQAAQIFTGTKTVIVPAQNMIEGYYALAMSQMAGDNLDERVAQMNETIKELDVISVSTASKNYDRATLSCSEGDFIALYKDDVVSCGSDLKTVIAQAAKAIPNLDSKYSCIIALGKNADEKNADELEELMHQIVPDADVSVISGGQDVYDFLIGF